jgi:hypothetical protein
VHCLHSTNVIARLRLSGGVLDEDNTKTCGHTGRFADYYVIGPRL